MGTANLVKVVDFCASTYLNEFVLTTPTIEILYPDVSYTLDLIEEPTDTVSLTRGNLDGYTYCGNRKIMVQDQSTSEFLDL
jgi:hypothetical protein